MRRSAVALTLTALIAAHAPARADEIVLARFRDYMEALRIQAGIPGLAAAIVGRTSVQWEQGFGQQDIERRIATLPDTPFHVDGLTEVVTAAIVMRCVEEGRLSLIDRIGAFSQDDPNANLTIREVLTHTSTGPDGLVYSYRPERLLSLSSAIRACSDDSYRETLSNWLNRFAMIDSVPGPDVAALRPPAPGIPDEVSLERYVAVLERLAAPYNVDARGRATPSQYTTDTLTPSSGLVSTVRDFAVFDLALRQGLILRDETLASAWRAPLGRGGVSLPHAIGYFSQSYNGEPLVWQFGIQESASSSLVVTAPERGLTFVVLANSSGLVKPFDLEDGDVTVSPFVRLFLGSFVR